ncbi:MAG: HAD family phosphatase [Sedimentisphaerales bacterium]|nr:HAD family phosphatase [Sedimentisphaerales bacterium]
MEKIKSVIFDWGGVLIEDPAPALMKYCAQIFNVSKEKYEKAHHKFSDDFQKNLINEDTFWERISGELKVKKPAVRSLWTDAFKASYIPREEMFNLAALLKKSGYKTALLSNTEAPSMRYFYRLGYDMFETAVFSCDAGVIKPHRKIFELALEKLLCTPEQAVFIDDKPEFIAAAEKYGLYTILFKSIEQTKNILAEIGVKHTGQMLKGTAYGFTDGNNN